jgi:arabinose-5-phosphate isomerase
MIMKGDVVVAISNSGETEEILRILPAIKRLGAHLVTVAGNPVSTLARAGDIFLPVTIKEEACPLGLAPTASTTATLALGDALAVALLVERGFREEDFALFHPGGALGKKLLLRVEDLMHSGDAIPLVGYEILMREALFVITAKGLGVTGVTNDTGDLVGIITDGDLRRALERGVDIMSVSAGEMMSKNPKRILQTELAAKALNIMEEYAITSLFVVGEERGTPVGIVHLHDLLKAGLA